MDLSLVIPTHNRPAVLAETLRKLAGLDERTIGKRCELIIVDNGSDDPPDPPGELPNGIRVRVIRLGENLSAAARNTGAQEASADWVVMLDDDSSLKRCPAIETLRSMPADVHAVGGEILLPSGEHEAGGLPEVVIGCGCAYRRAVFNALGGYDPSFDFYAEEYDVCARILLEGGRVLHTSGLRFEHRKSALNRSFGRILHRLVRNNGWVIRRYTPEHRFRTALDGMLERYERIARKEGVLEAYIAGLDELERTIDDQPIRRMDTPTHNRFIGRDACERHLVGVLSGDTDPVRIVSAGKGAEIISEVIKDQGIQIVMDDEPGARGVIGTLSPGPMTDAQLVHPSAFGSTAGFLPPGSEFRSNRSSALGSRAVRAD